MIAIFGATGALGGETARQLLAAGHRVVAVTRRRERATELSRLGAEVREADLVDPASLADACRGAGSVFASVHSLLGRGRYRSEAVDDVGHRALIDASRTAGVDHFVYTSVRGASPDHPVDFWRTKHAVEEQLKRSGLRWTILRPSAFMETHAHELLGKGILRRGSATILGTGQREVNFVAVRDVARFAVLALTEASVQGRTIEIGGPENHSRNAVVALYGHLGGRTPRVRHISPGMLRVLSVVIGPLHPGISRVMRASRDFEDVDERFDAGDLLREYSMPLTRLEDFVRERVAEARAAASPGA